MNDSHEHTYRIDHLSPRQSVINILAWQSDAWRRSHRQRPTLKPSRGVATPFPLLMLLAFCLATSAQWGTAGERTTLRENNWEEFVPEGKEVDAIYGDIVLRNRLIVAVVGNPVGSRNANMTVRHVDGAVIDLTLRQRPNDQLSAFYPTDGSVPLRATPDADDDLQAEEVSFTCQSPNRDGLPQVTVVYRLRDGEPFLRVSTRYSNPHAEAVKATIRDAVRADRSFEFQIDESGHLFTAQDIWWHQAYGIFCEDQVIVAEGDTLKRGRPLLAYRTDGNATVELAAGESVEVERLLIPGESRLQIASVVAHFQGEPHVPVSVRVTDPQGPVRNALVEIRQATADGGTTVVGQLRTPETGSSQFGLPAGRYTLRVAAVGRSTREIPLEATDSHVVEVVLDSPGYVTADIRGPGNRPTPCKVQFIGKGETPTPFFGPDTYIHEVHNVYYSHNGQFRQPLPEGDYDVIISYGPEYDAVFTTIHIQKGHETPLEEKLMQTVLTTGWISSDFHSHSSPSGDNTSSQRGRVLNLLAEQIEFAPCTEHNRISTYVPHLVHFGALPRMATCSGMELTGSPLPVNHQNAFPLVYRPRTQDGGAPVTDENPLVQIERLSFWDNGAEKIVQGNHPNLRQIVGDRDLDGEADEGFARMLGYMDVVEVHPPANILVTPPEELQARDRGNAIFNWLQMLNIGYRIPGVVNTDAHYNFHGSGWLRNYIKSPTDDPTEVRVANVVRAAERGNIVMTNGPFLEVMATTIANGQPQVATAGDSIITDTGSIDMHIKVQCSNWLNVNRVLVLLNGRPSESFDFRRRTHPAHFGQTAVKFEQHLTIPIKQDTHLIVVAVGEGLKLGPVMGPDRGKEMPVAVANPIFVDVDGLGFLPNGDLLDRPLPRKLP